MTPRWALVLGASSGFGEATARALAKAGYDIAGVHLDRKAGLKHVEEIVADITAGGRRARFFNLNAADDAKRQEVLDALEGDIQTQGGTVAVLMHSLAFGTLKPYIADDALTRANIEMTLDVMANSLVYWAQDLIKRRLMGQGGRIFSMTSSGSTRVIASYGAVSAAKCTLESHTRQLAVELAPHGVTVNALRGGVTRTPAAEKIPESHRLFEQAEQRNPHRRLTTTQDLARAVVALDGGEEISG
ncbi:MAG: SDR family oxidoreductase [Gemmatimonadetes bacterium]|nr:SDR family oxidoreductase [Gemmatimonadota bacterium]